MNTRRKLVIAIGAVTLAPLPSIAQPAARVYRIAFIGSGAASMYANRTDGLREQLRTLGYVEGKNLTVEYAYGTGEYASLTRIAAEAVARNPDLIIASGTPAIRAVQQATKTIPVIMASATDPIGSGFIQTLARPGGNITGLTNMTLDLSAKSYEFLRTIAPKARRIAVLMTNNPSHPAQFNNIQEAAKGQGLALTAITVTNAQQIDASASQMTREKIDALLVIADPLLISERQRIADLAMKRRLPAVYQTSEHVDVGGLLSYGADLRGLTARAAYYADRIFKGAKPAELPVEQPTTFELAVNLKTAQALGLKVPQSILILATRVIE